MPASGTRDTQRRADLLAGLRREIRYEGGKAKVGGVHNVDARDRQEVRERTGRRVILGSESRLGNGRVGMYAEGEKEVKGRSVEGLRAVGLKPTSLHAREPVEVRFHKKQVETTGRSQSVEFLYDKKRRVAPPLRDDTPRRHKAAPKYDRVDSPKRHLTSEEIHNRPTGRKRSSSTQSTSSLTTHGVGGGGEVSRIYPTAVYSSPRGNRALSPSTGMRFAQTPRQKDGSDNMLAHDENQMTATPTRHRSVTPRRILDLAPRCATPTGKRCTSPSMNLQKSGTQMTSILPHTNTTPDRPRRGRAYLGGAPSFTPDPLPPRHPTGRRAHTPTGASDVFNTNCSQAGSSFSDPYAGHRMGRESPNRGGRLASPHQIPTDPITHRHTVL